jgi:hypothetical protein
MNQRWSGALPFNAHLENRSLNMRRLAIAGFALAASAAFMTGGAQAQPFSFDSSVAHSANGAPVETVQYRRHRGGWHGPRRHYGGGLYRRGDRGAGVAAGVAGLAAGAIIAGAIANQARPACEPYPVYGAPAYGDAEAYCANRFKSWDPVSGTYLGYDGLRHPCP